MKKNKWITLLIAAILTVVVAITVTGCTPEPDPEDPGTTQEIKSVVALKASLLSMSGFTEELTVEGAKYDFKEQAIVVSLINNLCANIAASPMSQAKIDTLATTNFEGMEGPQDLLNLNLTEDDFVIVATAFYSAALTTFNNPALFDAAESAAQAYVDSVPAETQTAYEDYTKYYIVSEKLGELSQYWDSFTEDDFLAAEALLTSVGLEPVENYEELWPDYASERFENGIRTVVDDARDAAEQLIELPSDAQEAGEKLNSLAIRGDKHESVFGTFTDWVSTREQNQGVDANTITWLNTWLDALQIIVPSTTITIPADETGITNAWIASVASEIEEIRNNLSTIANPVHNYAKVSYHAEGIELGFEQTILSSEVLSPKIQALFPELPIFMYRAMSLLENEMLMGLFSDEGGPGSIADVDPSQLSAVIDSLSSNLTELKAFITANSVDLLALQGAFETLLQDEDFHLIAKGFLPFYEGIGALVSAGPNAIDFLQNFTAVLNAENINGIFGALQEDIDVELQMNMGIYLAKIVDSLLTEYQAAADFAEELSSIIIDDMDGYAQLGLLEQVGGMFFEMLPEDPVTFTNDMMNSFQVYKWGREIVLEVRWESDPIVIENYYTELQENLDEGAVSATISDFTDASQVDAYFLEVNSYLDELVEEETSGVRIGLISLISESLEGVVYDLMDADAAEIVQALASCTAVTGAEDENYTDLRTAMTDFINIFVNAGMFNEEENVMPPIDNTGENTIENFMTNFMIGLFEGMMDDGMDFESIETVLSETTPYEFTATGEGETTWVKIVAEKTGELTLSFNIEEYGSYQDLKFYHPNNHNAGYYYGGTPKFSVYAGMEYYLAFVADKAGELSMEIAEIEYIPAVE